MQSDGPTDAASRIKIDLYASCWNNADLLGYFFRHYDRFVRRYVIYDDGSDDGSLEILQRHPRVEIRDLAPSRQIGARTTGPLALSETCWRESSADADWVIITDIDEFVYHPDLFGYLEACRRRRVTIVPALGYDMIAPVFEDEGGQLADIVRRGAPSVSGSKLALFDPAAIVTLGYAPGRHTAEPTGAIAAPERDEVLLLHYRYLDFERVHARHLACRPRMSRRDIERDWGHRYFWSRETLRDHWSDLERDAVDVIDDNLAPWASHLGPRWWEPLRRGAVRVAKTPEAAPWELAAGLDPFTLIDNIDAPINVQGVLVLIDGRLRTPVLEDSLLTFDVEPGAMEVLLLSRSCIPGTMMTGERDMRRLGIGISAIDLQIGDDAPININLCDTVLSGGYHPVEFHDDRAFRWTNGCARLPDTFWEGARDVVRVTIRVNLSMVEKAALQRTNAVSLSAEPAPTPLLLLLTRIRSWFMRRRGAFR